MVQYEVAERRHGRQAISGSGPCAGLLNWPKHVWTRITRRPVGLARAIEIANASPTHAVVCEWDTATKVHDNGKTALVPDGWWSPSAETTLEPR